MVIQLEFGPALPPSEEVEIKAKGRISREFQCTPRRGSLELTLAQASAPHQSRDEEALALPVKEAVALNPYGTMQLKVPG